MGMVIVIYLFYLSHLHPAKPHLKQALGGLQ